MKSLPIPNWFIVLGLAAYLAIALIIQIPMQTIAINVGFGVALAFVLFGLLGADGGTSKFAGLAACFFGPSGALAVFLVITMFTCGAYGKIRGVERASYLPFGILGMAVILPFSSFGEQFIATLT